MTHHMHTQRRTLLLVTLAALFGRSQAAWGNNCYYDANGYERCDAMNYGARVGIAIAILALLLAIVLSMFYARKRRLARYQQQSLQNNVNRPGAPSGYYGGSSYPQNGAFGYAPQQGYNGPPAGPGQYYEQQSRTFDYGPDAGGYAGAPPPKYEPPAPGTQTMTKGPEGHQQSTTTASDQAAAAQYYAPPAGAPPGPAAGNDNRV